MDAPNGPLVDMPKLEAGLWIAKSSGRLWFRDDGGWQTRNLSTARLVRLMDARYPNLPAFGPTYVSTSDQPQAHAPVPAVLAYSVNRDNPRGPDGQQVFAVPDYIFDHWEQVGITDFEESCLMMSRAGAHAPQKQAAGWVGSMHCHPIREHLMELSEKYPDTIEAVNTGHWKSAAPDSKRLNVGHGRFISMPEQAAMYAYLLDVEGAGWSGRLKLLFHSQRPVLIQERPWIEYYFAWLKPFENYVPIARDLSDLQERVSWLNAHPEEAQRIAQNGLKFARSHLTRSSAVDYWAHVVKQIAPLSTLK